MTRKKSWLRMWLRSFWDQLGNFVTDSDLKAKQSIVPDFDTGSLTKNLDNLAEVTAYAVALAEEKQQELQQAISEYDILTADQTTETEEKNRLLFAVTQKIAALESEYYSLSTQSKNLLTLYQEKKSAIEQIAKAADDLAREQLLAKIAEADQELNTADLEQTRDRLDFETLKLRFLNELNATNRQAAFLTANQSDETKAVDSKDPIATARQIAFSPNIKLRP